ncbi:EVE domain-containing protein [Rickettsiella endosymbiont of Xylota segnis]|uniref:EVE domain-containing protein n=1 Tax=Rickettsiella endosymbiont of Xylota segnis TaxID=3066238 RepID=UPI0030D5A29A
MNYWLMKSEPTCFSIKDLAKRPQQTEPWDGVRNYQARNFLQAMQKGDLAFFYHSSCPTPGIVGMIKIVNTAYPDKTALQVDDHHYDPKSSVSKPRWVSVDVKLIRIFKSIISLEDLKTQTALKGMRLLQKGNRLSVMPLTPFEWQHILAREHNL